MLTYIATKTPTCLALAALIVFVIGLIFILIYGAHMFLFWSNDFKKYAKIKDDFINTQKEDDLLIKKKLSL